MPQVNGPELDSHFMSLAVAEANKSEAVESAYCVGCVIVCDGHVMATGFSRELPGNTHAEECALHKLKYQDFAVEQATLYTTMEPCSKRLSGNTPCAQLIRDAQIGRVVVGVREPDHFVRHCSGIDDLCRGGTRVDLLEGFEEACLAPNNHLLAPRR